MLADEHPEMGARGPRAYGGAAVSLHLYVPDVDETVRKAQAAGAKLVRPVEDKFYGDRMGSIEDPFGHHWHVSTHKEDVSPDEMARRAAAGQAQLAAARGASLASHRCRRGAATRSGALLGRLAWGSLSCVLTLGLVEGGSTWPGVDPEHAGPAVRVQSVSPDGRWASRSVRASASGTSTGTSR